MLIGVMTVTLTVTLLMMVIGGVVLGVPDVGANTNTALISRAWLISTEHVDEPPPHAPPQLENAQPLAGVAIRVTVESGIIPTPEHAAEQLSVPVESLIVPDPEKVGTLNNRDDKNEDDAVEADDGPAALVDVTLHVYVVAIVRSETRIGVLAAVPVWVVPPSEDTQVAVFAVIAAPLSLPTVNATDALLPTTRVTLILVGAPGAVTGVTAADAAEALLEPTLFVAVTVNV